MSSTEANDNGVDDAQMAIPADGGNGGGKDTADATKDTATLYTTAPSVETMDDPTKDKQPSQETVASETNESTAVDRSWDYTNRKVIVRNILKHMKQKEIDASIKSWLDALEDPNSIRVSKIKKAPRQPWIQLTLETEDMVQPFIEHMNSNKFTNRKGNLLRADRVTLGDNKKDNRKRKSTDSNGEDEQSNAKKHKPNIPKTDDEVRDVITPFWRKSYDEQLIQKQRDMIKKCAIKIVQEVKKRFRNIEREAKRNENRNAVPVYDWVSVKRAIEVLKILPSPHQTQYRNKCELNFGYSYEPVDTDSASQEEKMTDVDTDDTTNAQEAMKMIPSVGFHASGWSGGVSRPHMLSNIPSEACAIADVVNEFLKDSPTAPYDSRAHRGLWRVLTIRISRRTKECMIIISHAPPSGGVGAKDDTDDCSNVFQSEKARLLSMLTDAALTVPRCDYKVVATEKESSDETETTKQAVTPVEEDEAPKSFRVTSVFFQEFDGVSNPGPEHPVQHAYGKRSIQERLGNCTFQISPGAFFQVNTEGAETLYNQVLEKVREVAPKPEETLLLDVCCGTGTIGQYCMKEGAAGRVLGVDISAPAIEDAKINAELNGFGSNGGDGSERTRFVAARAEQVLGQELRKEGASSSVVAVVDPAREGLHPDVLRTLRSNGKIQRIVYVSCNPTGSLINDAGILCAPPTKKYAGRPYYPSSAQPVDMFPQTPHCELVMTFDRLPESPSKTE